MAIRHAWASGWSTSSRRVLSDWTISGPSVKVATSSGEQSSLARAEKYAGGRCGCRYRSEGCAWCEGNRYMAGRGTVWVGCALSAAIAATLVGAGAYTLG